jgi:hypothetical protein
MIQNLQPRADLIGLARKHSKEYDTKRITPAELDQATAEGWRVVRKGRKSLRVAKNKRKSDLLESRVWMLFYKMGFQHLSGKNGCILPLSGDGKGGPEDQIDVVAADSEVALAVECKSVDNPKSLSE